MPHENGQLTAEELEPTEEDFALAERLVAEGWKSVSSKHRRISRFTTEHIPVKDLIRPELLDTPEAKWVLRHMGDRGPSLRNHGIPGFHFPVEERQLSVREYRAFRQRGGVADW